MQFNTLVSIKVWDKLQRIILASLGNMEAEILSILFPNYFLLRFQIQDEMRGYGRASNDPVLFSWRGGSLSHIVREGVVDQGG